MSANGLVIDAGRMLKARLLRGESIPGLGWFAIGAGNWADKENPPPEVASATGLAAELARKQISRSAFLEEDAINGTIRFNGTLYKEVAGPTKAVAYFATLTEEEAQGFAICEEAVFGGLVTTTASPYALASQVIQPGTCYWIRHRGVYVKGTRDQYDLIAVFDE